MPLVSITRLRVRRRRFLPAFLIQALRSALEARRATGNLSVALLADRDRTYWTRTLWRDEVAMRAFMTTGVHRRVMPRLLEWCDEAALVHWLGEAGEPPSWAEAHRRLVADGRASKVKHPSEAQRRFAIPPPRHGATLSLK